MLYLIEKNATEDLVKIAERFLKVTSKETGDSGKACMIGLAMLWLMGLMNIFLRIKRKLEN